MALTQVTGPYPIFTDLDGTPLDDGYLYIGLINQDPEQNPIQVFWDANLLIPATQPIRTSNGYAYRNGTPALLYTAGEFSITIRNKREEFVLYSPVGYGFDPAAVSASVVKNDFIGDGVEVNFVLSAAPSTILATNVFINGVYQEKDSYSILGNVLTFSVAPPLSSSIEVMTNETGVINSGNATAISYTAGFAGAVAQTVQTKLEQYVSVKDFGAVGDGVTSDSAALNAAYASLPSTGGVIFFPKGQYLLDQAHDFTNPITLVGEGCSATPGAYAASQVFKAASVSGPVITVRGLCSGFINIGFEGKPGNTGNGLQISCGRALISNVSSHLMGQDGVRIGDPVTPTNCNLMTVNVLYCRSNGRDGLHISDTDGTMPVGGPNCNGGNIQKVETASNGRDGIRVYNSWYLTIIGDVPQVNTGVGLHLINDGAPAYNGSRYHTIIGGEQNEFNTGGNIVSSSYITTFLGVQPGASFTNTDPFPAVFNNFNTKIIGPEFVNGQISPAVASGASGTTFYPLAVRNLSNSANGRGVGLEFQPPDGVASYRTGARITVAQETTNKDRITFSANNSGVMTDYMLISPNAAAVAPAVDVTYSFGTAANRWSRVYAAGLSITDGVSAPATLVGYATIYVDTADGDLKIKFGDGTVKTIVTDS